MKGSILKLVWTTVQFNLQQKVSNNFITYEKNRLILQTYG